MGMLQVLIVLAVQAEARSEPPKSFKTLSVCEVIANDPTKLNGQVVKIRGMLGSTDEGMWLLEEYETHLVTKGVTWGNSLSVYVDLSDKTIARSWEKMGAKLTTLHADTRGNRVWVTVIGRIETRASMDDEVLSGPYGLAKAAGFGHLGGSPAEINVLSVQDTSVERPH